MISRLLLGWLLVVPLVAEDTLDLQARLGTVTPDQQLREDGWYVWGGSPIRGEDGRHYLFYARWPAGMKGRPEGESTLFKDMRGWLKYSEIAAAVSDSPAGPYRPLGTVLKGSGEPERWDHLNAHNPHVRRFDGKVYLYHVATRPVEHPDEWMSLADGQRTGVVVADSVADLVAGRFTRLDAPLIAPDGKHTFCRAVNPSVTLGRDGKYLLMFKARSAPTGGHMIHWVAVADGPAGPFTLAGPALTDARYSAEDPYFWYDARRDRYYAIVKDFARKTRELTPQFGALALVTSEKGWADWKPAGHRLVSLREFRKPDGTFQKLANLERPQLLFDASGEPGVLFAAAAVRDPFQGHLSFNIHIPLVAPATGGLESEIVRGKPTLRMTSEGDAIRLEVHDPKGIGAVRLRPGQGGWPGALRLRLHLGGLESLQVKSGDTALRWSVSSTPPHRIRVSRLPEGKEVPVAPGDALRDSLRIVRHDASRPETIPLTDGFFDVEIPKELIDDPELPLVLEWIDFYR